MRLPLAATLGKPWEVGWLLSFHLSVNRWTRRRATTDHFPQKLSALTEGQILWILIDFKDWVGKMAGCSEKLVFSLTGFVFGALQHKNEQLIY